MMTDTIASLNRETSLQERWNTVRSHPSNQACAECSGENPAWIVILSPATPTGKPMGVLSCHHCYPYYHQLGPHVVREVKSLDDGNWTLEEVRIMDDSGNQVTNDVYEAKLKELDDDRVKAKLEEKRSDDMLAFLTDKYQRRLFFFDEKAHPKGEQQAEDHHAQQPALQSKLPRRNPTTSPRRLGPERASSLRDGNRCRSRSPDPKMKSDLAYKRPLEKQNSPCMKSNAVSSKTADETTGRSPRASKLCSSRSFEKARSPVPNGQKGVRVSTDKFNVWSEQERSIPSTSNSSRLRTKLARTHSACSTREETNLMSVHGEPRLESRHKSNVQRSRVVVTPEAALPSASNSGRARKPRPGRMRSSSPLHTPSRSSEGRSIRMRSIRSMTDGTDVKREPSSGRPDLSRQIVTRNHSNRSKRDDIQSSKALPGSDATSKQVKPNSSSCVDDDDDDGDRNLQSSSGHKDQRPRLKKIRSVRSKGDVNRRNRSNSPFRNKQIHESQVDTNVASCGPKQGANDAQKSDRAMEQFSRGRVIRSRSESGPGRSPLRKEARASNRHARSAALDRPSFEIAAAERNRRPRIVRATSDRNVSSRQRARPKQVAAEESQTMKGSSHREQLILWNSMSGFASFTPHEHMLSKITARRTCNLRLGSRDGRERSFDDTEVDYLRASIDTREDTWDIDFSDSELDGDDDQDGSDEETSDDETWSASKDKKAKSWKKKLVKSGKKKLKSGKKKLKETGKVLRSSKVKKQLDFESSPDLPQVFGAKGA